MSNRQSADGLPQSWGEFDNSGEEVGNRQNLPGLYERAKDNLGQAVVFGYSLPFFVVGQSAVAADYIGKGLKKTGEVILTVVSAPVVLALWGYHKLKS